MSHDASASHYEINSIQAKNMKFACWIKLCHMQNQVFAIKHFKYVRYYIVGTIKWYGCLPQLILSLLSW